jgi:hypothetical protein
MRQPGQFNEGGKEGIEGVFNREDSDGRVAQLQHLFDVQFILFSQKIALNETFVGLGDSPVVLLLGVDGHQL